MNIPNPLPQKDEIERLQLYWQNEKLKAEADKLRQDAKPEGFFSRILKSAALLTAIAAVLGAYDSYHKTLDESSRAQISDQRKAIGEATKQLSADSTISKVAGVSVLFGYLGKDYSYLHRQILTTLAIQIATEKDKQTNAAVLDYLTSIGKMSHKMIGMISRKC